MGKLIGLLGRKRVGKDTVADYLINNYNFTKHAFANPIKEVLKIMSLELGMDVENWPPENIEELVKKIEEPF